MTPPASWPETERELKRVWREAAEQTRINLEQHAERIRKQSAQKQGGEMPDAKQVRTAFSTLTILAAAGGLKDPSSPAEVESAMTRVNAMPKQKVRETVLNAVWEVNKKGSDLKALKGKLPYPSTVLGCLYDEPCLDSER
jgi:hypothetical protein